MKQNSKPVLTIQAFKTTTRETGMEPKESNCRKLLDTASALHKVGFHREAREYEKRARRIHNAVLNRDFAKWERKKAQDQFVKDKKDGVRISRSVQLLNIPHIKDVKTVKVVAIPAKMDSAQMLPPRMRDAIMSDRNAAWHFHKTGGVA